MNAERRKRLDAVRAELRCIIDDEQSALDSLPENMQAGERADKMEETIETMEAALQDLEGINA
jgi:hypothetical protein